MKLTPTMLSGLQKMEQKAKRQDTVMAEPNDNTGRALEARGLVEYVETVKGWRRYRITDAGRLALKNQESDRG